MSDQPSNYNPCQNAAGHRDHLCHLMEKGQTAEVKARSSKPAFVCHNCNALANEAEDLCNPSPLARR